MLRPLVATTRLVIFALFLSVSSHHASATPVARPDDTRPPSTSPPYDFHAPRPIRRLSLFVNVTTLWSDCNPMFSAPVVNATSPGPTIRVRAGERLLVNVTNLHPTSPTTMHWHGLSMRLNPASDGTPMIAQWPIEPGHWFEYDIRLSEDERGTYMYHTHVELGSMTAYGALIIEDPPPSSSSKETTPTVTWGDGDLQRRRGRSAPGAPYKYHEDRILALGDYWSMTSPDISAGRAADPFVWPGNPQSLLVNGQQKRECNSTAVASRSPTCPTSSLVDSSKPLCDYPEIRIQYGKTYRFRIIGSQTMMYISLRILDHSVEGNRLELIEADGTYLEAFGVDHVEVAPGQRYSWLVAGMTREEVEKDGKRGVYWIRMKSRWRVGPSGWLRLVYEDDAGETLTPTDDIFKLTPPPVAADAKLLPPERVGWILDRLSPLRGHAPPCPADAEVTRTVIINAQQHQTMPGGKGVQWRQNSAVYDEVKSTRVPYLVSLYAGVTPRPSYDRAFEPLNTTARESILLHSTASDLELARKHNWQQGFDAVTGLYLARAGEVVDIIIINRPSAIANNTEIHPWHMHAAKHWTRTIQAGTFSFPAYERALSSRAAYTDPIPRDTTSVFPSPGAAYLNETVKQPELNDGGWSVLRYKVDRWNAGVFPLHCHLTFHLKMGMAVVWGLAIDELMQKDGPLEEAYGSKPDRVQGMNLGYLKPRHNVAAVL